jgi:leader peptidase (prepilin peptidase)/N-methyltransferase
VTWFAFSVIGAFGLLIGSFLNVVIWRVPRGESIVRPGSACPTCGSAIRPWDNIPVVSWLVLRGRCRDCRGTISVRYPIVEATTSLLFLAVALQFRADDAHAWAIPAYLYLAAIAVALALIDLDVHRLPNPIVLPAYPVGLALLAAASWASGDWSALLRAVIGAAGLYLLYFLMMVASSALLGATGMGFGDVKLAGVLGMYLAWLGWGPLAIGAFAAFLLGGGFSIILLATGAANRKTGVPFGPWMLMGAAVGIGVGTPLWSAYLGLLV